MPPGARQRRRPNYPGSGFRNPPGGGPERRGGGSQSAASANAGAAPGAANRGSGGKKRGGYNPQAKLRELETGQVLTGKDITRAANALTTLEVRPQVRGYARLAKQLAGERESEAKGLGKLGTQLQSGVTNVYQNIAQTEAQSLATQQALANQLNTASADIVQQGAADLSAVQNTQTQGVADALTARGAPGGGTAQQELAAAVASQQASQSANSQAQQQFAAQQGSSYGNLATMMAGATQQQGGAAVGGIGSTVIQRIAKSGREYGGDIREARAKQAEAKASRGAVFNKNLLSLRGQEQEFMLGKQAVRSEKEKLALSKQEAAEARKQRGVENSQWAQEFGLKQYEATHPNAGSDEIAEKKQEIKQDVNEIKSVIPTAVSAAKGSGAGNNFEAYVAYVNTKTSAPPQLVRKVLKRWWEKRANKRQAQGRKQQREADKIIGTKIPGESIVE